MGDDRSRMPPWRVELQTNGALADSVRRDLAMRGNSFIVPQLLDVEAMSALRRLVAAGTSMWIGASSSSRDFPHCPRSATRTYHYSTSFGNYATTLRPTTLPTSRSLRPRCAPRAGQRPTHTRFG